MAFSARPERATTTDTAPETPPLDSGLAHDDLQYSALDDAREFKYAGLPEPTYLRILEIKPGPVNTHLICQLHEYANAKDERHEYDDQSDFTGYEALSWYWAPNSGTKQLLIVGRHVQYLDIQEELYAALSALRHKDHSRYVWVDRICINQADNEERNFQVSRMSSIYNDARCVCVWLGRADQSSKRALEFVRAKLSNEFAYTDLCNDGSFLDDWVALKKLIERPWFRRRWIVQEITLAQRATVYCGNSTMDWNALKTVITTMIESQGVLSKLSVLAANEQRLGFPQDYFEEIRGLAAVRLINLSDRLCTRSGETRMGRTSRLEEIVSGLPMFESSEPRDTIYALLALADDTFPISGTVPEFLGDRRLNNHERALLGKISSWLPRTTLNHYPVNYKQPVSDVYQQYIRFVIAHSRPDRALDVILRPFAPDYKQIKARNTTRTTSELGQEEALPSWIPRVRNSTACDYGVQDIHQESRVSALGALYGGGRLFVSTPGVENCYNAAASREYNPKRIRFRKRKDHFSMFVEGFILDKVYQVEPASLSGQIPAGWLRLARRLDVKQNLDAFWRTLVADQGANGRTSLYYKNILQDMLSRIPANHAFNTREALRKATKDTVLAVLKHMMNTISGRCLIETEELGLVGLAPQGTNPGDLVCIFYGCTVPVILRRDKAKDVAQDRLDDDQMYLEDRKAAIEKLRGLRSKRAVANDYGTTPMSDERTGNNPIYNAGSLHFNTSTTQDTSVTTTPAGLGHDDRNLNAQDVRVVSSRLGVVVEPRNEWSESSTFVLRVARQVRRFRAILLCLLSITLVSQRPAELTGFILLVFCLPHILNDIVMRDSVTGNGSAVMFIAFLAVLTNLAETSSSPPLAMMIVAFTVSLFPELLPPGSSLRVRSLLVELLRTQALFLERIATMAAGEYAQQTHHADTSGANVAQRQLPQQESFRASRVVGQSNIRSDAGRHRQAQQAPKDHITELYSFQLIGDSYIDTMMSGKAVEMTSETTSTSERLWTVMFELR